VNLTKNLEGEIKNETYQKYSLCTAKLTEAELYLAYINALQLGKELIKHLGKLYKLNEQVDLPKRSNVEIGDYTYYSDNKKSPEFYDNIEHHYEFFGDKLIIGKFCAIAEGVKFIMNGANNRMDGITTYPFNIFGGGWEKVTPTVEQLPFKGDTVIGNDVWIGQNVTIMPGVKVGDGAIIAANSTVVKNIEPYTIYGGNPAKLIKKRFSDENVELLLKLQWWNWEEDKIFNNLEKLTSEVGLDQLMKEYI